MIFNILMSVVVLVAMGAVAVVINATAPLISGPMAVNQLQNSDMGYYSGVAASYINGSTALLTILTLLILVAIWYTPVKEAMSKKTATFMALLAFGGITFATPSHAYYDTVDQPEFVEIRPNETAFLIPLVGANRTTQGQFGSRDYLNENKVAAKRIQIPHVEVRTAGFTRNYYVPAARLIVVDRTPYAREWVSASDRGTSSHNQGFHFETRDSIGIRTGVVVTAYVKEEDTASFLYWFGVEQVTGDANRPEIMYASVNRGQSLATIMDSVVRREAQAILAREFGNRNLVQAIAEKAKIMDVLRESLIRTFAEKGITIGTIGYAESLTFDNPAIQVAIDSVVIAERQAAAVSIIAPQMETLQRQAYVRLLESMPAALAKWNGQLPNLPSVVSLPPDALSAMAMLSGMVPQQGTPRPSTAAR